jgi:hypothetical protein
MAAKSKRLTKWLMFMGVLLILSGLGFSIWNLLWYRTRTWFPLDQPILLTVGQTKSPTFRVNVEENFIIQLAVDRDTPQPIVDDVLGIGELGSAKTRDARGFKLTWAVKHAGNVVKQGTSDGHNEGYWSRKIGRMLGYFHTKKGEEYQLEVNVLEDGSQLAPYHPRLITCVDLFTLDGYAMGEGLSEFAGYLVAGVGGILLIFAALLRWRANKIPIKPAA